MKNKFSNALSLALIVAMLFTAVAFADQLDADADALVAESPHGNSVTETQNGGITASYDFSALIKDTPGGGSGGNDVFAATTDTVSVTITKGGAWLSGGTSGPWTFTAYDTPEAGTIEITVPCGSEGTTNTMTVSLSATASNGKVLNPNNKTLSYIITAGPDDPTSCAPSNTPPTVEAGGPYSGNEGSDIALDGGSAFDSDGTVESTVWTIVSQSVSPGTCTLSNADSLTVATIKCTDNGSATVRLTATDDDGASSYDDATVTIENVAPVIEACTMPEPVAVNTSASVSVSFSDVGTADTHTASFDWGDASVSTGTVTGVTASGDHTYTAAGIYTVGVEVKDDDGGSDSENCQYVVVYDPSAGFVTGGGWIWSPAGAYTADPELTGKANFGFVSKYKKGQTVPDGNTQFQFQAGNLNFHSTSYQWLVVSGSKATYKGYGTINGSGDYGFLLSAIDGSPDKFRIKIWSVDSGDVVYDNNIGGGDDAEPATALGGGSIVIHTGGKK